MLDVILTMPHKKILARWNRLVFVFVFDIIIIPQGVF